MEAVRVGGPPEGTQRYVYAYDPNGNRVNLNWPGPPGPNTQGVDYTYDREDRLVQARAYQTNHRGHRTDREVTRLFYDGLGRRLAKEYDPRTGAGGVKRTEYTFDGLDPVVEYFRWNGQREELYRGGPETFSPTPLLLTLRRFLEGTEGQTYWYHPDGRGSVAGVTKHQGQSTHNYRYDAYGQLLPAQGNWTDPHNHYTFSGKEWDEHLGLYEFGFRLYDPWAGVWLTQDPLRGNPLRPHSLHRYTYVSANPVNFVDRYGLQTCGYNILTGEQECFGEATGMGWTPPSVLPPLVSMPAGAYPDNCSPTLVQAQLLARLAQSARGQRLVDFYRSTPWVTMEFERAGDLPWWRQQSVGWKGSVIHRGEIVLNWDQWEACAEQGFTEQCSLDHWAAGVGHELTHVVLDHYTVGDRVPFDVLPVGGYVDEDLAYRAEALIYAELQYPQQAGDASFYTPISDLVVMDNYPQVLNSNAEVIRRMMQYPAVDYDLAVILLSKPERPSPYLPTVLREQ